MLYYKKRESKKKHVLTIVILIALIIFSSLNPKATTLSSNVASSILMPINKVFYSITTSFQSAVDSVFGSKANRERVEALEKENDQLNEELNKLKIIVADKKALENEYEFQKKNSNYINAKVISLEPSNLFDRFVIDKGSNSGIKKGDMVVQGYMDKDKKISKALVGRVEEVGLTTSKVVSIMDDKYNLSFKVVASNDFGIVNRRSEGALEGYLLNKDSKVAKGDDIVTSGIGEVYEPNIYIGRVREVFDSTDRLNKEVVIDSPVDYTRLYSVFVIQNNEVVDEKF